MTTNTTLQFEGAVSGVKQAIGGEYGGGSLQLTLTVKEPRRPFKPSPPGQLLDRRGNEQSWKKRPEPPAKKAKEDDAAYAKRAEPLLAQQREYDSLMANYRGAVAEYEKDFQRYQLELQDYMWLTGSAGILGAKAVLVSLQPMNRGFAEMDALLLPPPVDVSPLTPDPSPATGEGNAEPVIGASETDICPECGHERMEHDDEPPPACAAGAESGPECGCERGTSGW